MRRAGIAVICLHGLVHGCASTEEPRRDPVDARPDGEGPDVTLDETGIDDGVAPDVTPIEDTTFVDDADDDLGPPPAGSRIEAAIGPQGGQLVGAPGSVLEGISLTIPEGAVASEIRIVVDAAAQPAAPFGTRAIGRYVAVGPEGVVFAKPARLRLRWSTATASPTIGALARIGFGWSSLLDPKVEGAILEVSLGRTSGALPIELASAPPQPTVAAFSPGRASAGSVVFVEGAGFAITPLVAGSVVSGAFVGGRAAEILGWTPETISFRVPTDAGSGAIEIVTPGGRATADGGLVAP